EGPPRFFGNDQPRQIGRLHLSIHHRTGNAETGALNARFAIGEKFFQHGLQSGKFLARKEFPGLGTEFPFTARKKRQMGLGPADVASKDEVFVSHFCARHALVRSETESRSAPTSAVTLHEFVRLLGSPTSRLVIGKILECRAPPSLDNGRYL